MTSYDSTNDTLGHISRVRKRIGEVIDNLSLRAAVHDRSKLEEPEKSAIDRTRPILKEMEFGTEEYTQLKREWSDHHHSVNRHHVEFHRNGLSGMTLSDIVEMLCDWQAATETHKEGDNILKSIDILAERYEMSYQLKQILVNTALEMGWLEYSPHREVRGNAEYDLQYVPYVDGLIWGGKEHNERAHARAKELEKDGYALVLRQNSMNGANVFRKEVGKVF